MATKVETSHAMMVRAARLKDGGARMDVEAGMAKMIASEYANEVVREVKFMLIGEGTSDIQKMIIGRSLLKEYAAR